MQVAAKSCGDAEGGQLVGNVAQMLKDKTYDINGQVIELPCIPLFF